MTDKIRRLFEALLDKVPATTLLEAARHARAGADDLPKPSRTQALVIEILVEEFGAEPNDG